MRVHYITITFPHPGETFAGVDVRALVEAGAEVQVHSLRPRHPQVGVLLEKWGLSEVVVTHLSWSDIPDAVLTALQQPGLIGDVLGLALQTIRKPGQFARTLFMLPRWLSIYKRIEAENPEVIHLFWGHYPALIARLVQKRLPQIVTSVFLGAYDIDWSYPLSPSAARNADIVWTHSHANVPDLVSMGLDERRIRMAYRGLDLSRIPPEQPKIEGRIVTAGRLKAFKGMDTVLHAFRKVLRNCPGASLIILGDGPERMRLEDLAASLGIAARVEFRGHVHHEEVLREFASAQVMLFMSRKTSERLPNVVKEAMACRCYCVATATPGIDELIPGKEFGAIVPPDDAGEAARATTEALIDVGLRDRVASNARAHVFETFDSRATMRTYAKEWSRLVNSKSQTSENRFSDERAKVNP